MNRREALAALGATAVAAQAQDAAGPYPHFDAILRRHDEAVVHYMSRQITDPKARWRGNFADANGLFWPGTLSGILETLATAFVYPQSKHYKSNEVFARMQMASETLLRETSADGNIDNPVTNWNSPPDTAFAVRSLASGAILARRAGNREASALLEPWLRKAGASLARGGIHTPNHRWVVCAALAQVHELFSEPSYLKRIDQWLAEGIDIDEDGQYDERSTAVYNPITDNAFTTMAAKLKRPELLDPVRKNLNAMLYLLHPGYEVVTEISRRQDLNQRGDMGGYWFSLQHLAVRDNDGRFATLSRHFAPTRGSLPALLEYPEINIAKPSPQPVPDTYEKTFPGLGLTRIRRGELSACIFADNSRFFTLRKGVAVINAVRFASAFFGKAQFRPTSVAKREGAWFLTQSLEGPYYQPFQPPRRIQASEWTDTQKQRPQSEVMKLTQSAEIRETPTGFRIRIRANGTKDVPLAIEVNLREGGKLDGVEPAPDVPSGFLLSRGQAVYKLGGNTIKFGPGLAVNTYTQVRGAESKLSGPSVYLTGLTPFDHTLDFECS
ncbi:MAG TPA: hypothetical protein VE621_20615 [Bryobacteraceae bacterium]|nr:hypothetical protein [Bryobacteraceae bacterium]